ncbi:alpha/beta hydrolase [Pedobacter sp. KBW06]|nr:alpha/beta hydrolase [Pedobacter sp. KBW06]
MNYLLIAMTSCFLIASCKKNEARKKNVESFLSQKDLSLPSHKLSTYSRILNSKYLLVFEAGLGDDHSVWPENELIKVIRDQSDLLTYDRAGYGTSGLGPGPRNIATLSAELEKVIDAFSGQKKVILIGHSIGGMIIRDYAIKHPSKTAALLFIDPSHEHYNQPSGEEEDRIYNIFNNSYGAGFGGTREARVLIEDSRYMSTLATLPNIPVTVISSMKTDQEHPAADRKKWFEAHEFLGTGLNDFMHISTVNSGHYIMKEEPDLIIRNINSLLAKLP